MAYRSFDTATWKDPWFEELSPNAKLLFIYLWTNDTVNQSGLYQISQRRMEFEIGFKVDAYMPELSKKVAWDAERQIVWVKNFCRRQCANPKFFLGALKCLEPMPLDLQKEFYHYNVNLFDKYGMDTVSIPNENGKGTYPLSGTDTGSDTGSGTDKNTLTRKSAKAVPDKKPSNGKLSKIQQQHFEQFWQTYPKKKSKGQALTAWQKIKPSEQLVAQIIATIKQAITSEDWTKEGGRYIPHPATWLNAMGWEDDYSKPAAKPYSDKTARTIANLKTWMGEENEKQTAVQ